MELPELSYVYSLFVDGMCIGGALSAVPFLIGYAISSIYKLIRRN